MVEVADSLLGAAVQADIERNVLVEGIRLLGVVAHGVAGSHIHVFLGLVDLAGFLAEAVEAVVGLDLAGVDAAAVAVLAVGQVGNISVQQAAVLIIDHDAERCLLDDDLETRPLDNGLPVAVGQGCGGGLDALAAVLHQLVGAGLPCGHGQAVGGFIPVAVKARADAQYIVGQEPDAQLYSVGGYGIIASAVLDSAAGVAHFHRFSPFLHILHIIEWWNLLFGRQCAYCTKLHDIFVQSAHCALLRLYDNKFFTKFLPYL